MRDAMIGTGYVGLVSGACFADFGHHVTCVDKDAAKIAALRQNKIPVYEPGLDRLVEANMRAGRLDFATDLEEPVSEADAVFIAVSARLPGGVTATPISATSPPQHARSPPRSPASPSW